MNKETIIRKITSRKFWIALVAFVTALLTAFNVPDASAAQITSIIMAFGSHYHGFWISDCLYLR